MKTKKSKIDIDHLAKLANLEISDKDKEKYARQLGSILAYVEQLKEINTDEVPATASSIDLTNISFRDSTAPEQTLEDLTGLKTEKIAGKTYFVTKKITWE